MKHFRLTIIIAALLLFSVKTVHAQDFSIIGKWTALKKVDGKVYKTNTHLIFKKDSIAWEVNSINGKEERRYYVKNNTIHLYDTDWIIGTEIKIIKKETGKMRLSIEGFEFDFAIITTD